MADCIIKKWFIVTTSPIVIARSVSDVAIHLPFVWPRWIAALSLAMTIGEMMELNDYRMYVYTIHR
jgi:hypothetical protein